VSGQQLVACFELQGELADALREPRVLLLQARLFPGTLRVVKGVGGLGQQLIAPLLRERLTNLRLVTQLCDRLALQTRNDNPGFRMGVPLPAFHG
jgi:hypothetical protein